MKGNHAFDPGSLLALLVVALIAQAAATSCSPLPEASTQPPPKPPTAQG